MDSEEIIIKTKNDLSYSFYEIFSFKLQMPCNTLNSRKYQNSNSSSNSMNYMEFANSSKIFHTKNKIGRFLF